MSATQKSTATIGQCKHPAAVMNKRDGGWWRCVCQHCQHEGAWRRSPHHAQQAFYGKESTAP